MVQQYIAAGGYWAGLVEKGSTLTIIDVEGGQGVDFLCYNAHRTEERSHAPNTIKASLDLKLTTGHILYSDDANPLMTVTYDSIGRHDTIGGCCSERSNRMLYGVSNYTGCRENFLAAMVPYGMDRRDVVPNINFFCDVPVSAERTLIGSVFADSPSTPGAAVSLRAEMDVLSFISNCPQINNPCNGGRPKPIKIRVE